MSSVKSCGAAPRQVLRLRQVHIRSGSIYLTGDLTIPEEAKAIVIFAHGSGGSRLSPRDLSLAGELHRAELATLLVDLLTPEEEAIDEETGGLRFNLDLLAARLADVTYWVRRQKDLQDLPIGYCGAGTGAAAALKAAACRPDLIGAIVARGGRPDLAMDDLPRVQAPTLLIIGGQDPAGIGSNREAWEYLEVEKEFAIIAGATHLFQEQGALEDVSRLAQRWFERHLVRAAYPAGMLEVRHESTNADDQESGLLQARNTTEQRRRSHGRERLRGNPGL